MAFFQRVKALPVVAATILALVVLLCAPPEVSAQNPASAGPSIQIRWALGLYGEQSPPSNAVSTLIGPFAPGTQLGLFILGNNPSGTTQNVTQIRVSWPGLPTDFVPSGIAIDANGQQTQAVVLNNVAIWAFDPVAQPGVSTPAWTYGLDIFSTFGTIGDVQAEFLPITIEMTDNVFGTQMATFLVEMAPSTPSPTTPAPTAKMTAPAASRAPESTPTSTPNPTISTSIPIVATRTPTVSTPTPSPTPAPSSTPAPTQPTEKRHKRPNGARRMMA